MTENSRNLFHLAISAVVLCAVLLSGCQTTTTRQTTSILSLIPLPAVVDRAPGKFVLHQGAVLNVHSRNGAALGVARYFSNELARARDLHLDLQPGGDAESTGGIAFNLDPNFLVRGDTADEGYELTVSSQRIVLIARTPHGLFNGAVTLWQLLTQNIDRANVLTVPCLHIEDHPRFAWRGLMLDSARHYQSPQFIKRLLDRMALQKLDVFQWHLTDDQGWRIQIKRYPKLTEIGAWRIPASVNATPGRYGGFYTQDEIRDIVRYARARFITIVPEIEMPGHAQAAIAAYPELGVTGKRPPVSHDWGVHTYLYNVDDSTFEFLENVLTEVMDLFPGRYIHVGGDEAAKDQWQASAAVQRRMHELHIANADGLQSYFIARIGRFLAAHGRRLVGWDEILQGGVPPDATVMSWQGEKGGIVAARLGHDVVMAPSPIMYFDHVQSARHDEPPGRPDVVSLADVYAYDPLPKQLDATLVKHVLGAQANLWTEYMDTPARVEHAAFPRVAALAEALWSAPARRNWNNFLQRMPAQIERYRASGIDFADSAFVPDVVANARPPSGKVNVEIDNQTQFGTLRYTLDGREPTVQSPVYQNPLTVSLPTELNTNDFAANQALAAPRHTRIDAMSLLRKNSDELKSCKPAGQGLPLRLPGPAIGGGQTVYRVDIFDPCWIYPHADLDAANRISVAVAELPYNFQLWKDVKNLVLRQPQRPGGELQVRMDGCAGPQLAAIALAGAAREDATATLNANLAKQHGTHDLCLYFTRSRIEPMWAIDTVQLLPDAASGTSARRPSGK